MKKLLKFLFVLLTVTLVGFTTWVLYFNGEQKLRDWWFLRNYHPTSEIAILATNALLSEAGKDIFYVTDPELIDKGDGFTQICNKEKEHTIVLGCYTGDNRIYVLNIDDKRLPDIEEVTAAHETLHAVYERFSVGELKSLNAALEFERSKIKNERILKLIKLYEDTIYASDDSSHSKDHRFYTELYAIFGTELSNVSPRLEKFYTDYFTDRSKLVAKAQGYSQTFDTLSKLIENYDQQIADLKTQLDKQKSSLEEDIKIINQKQQELDNFRDNDEIADYNQLVPEYNQLVTDHREAQAAYNGLVEEYNQIVKKRNQQAYDQRDLLDSINDEPQSL